MPAFTDEQLRNVQGLGIAGYRKDHQELVFAHFASGDGLSKMLKWAAPRTASAWEVGQFNELFSEIRQRTGEETIEATWMGVALTAAGLDLLGYVAPLPPGDRTDAFVAGMAARAPEIGDTRAGDVPTSWEKAFQQKGGVHVLVVVAADNAADLGDRVTEVTEKISGCHGEVVYQERGATLPGSLRGHEHFGFRDGSSQPSIDGYDPPPASGEPPAVPAGEFVFGYPDATGAVTVTDPALADSSMLVFRRLTQDVAGFRAQAAAGVPGADPALSPAQLAAKIVGRWPSGAPLELFPDADPGDGNAVNAFAFHASDDDGRFCPRWAHIRKANPRDETTPDPSGDAPARPRMVRRGIPFGRPLPATATADDGHPRGLHFLCVVADPARQFEFIQRQWLNDPNFPGGRPATTPGAYGPPVQGAPDGPDPLVGEHDDTGAQCVLHQPGGIHPFGLNAPVVHVTAGEYFLLPSIALLTTLAKAKQ